MVEEVKVVSVEENIKQGLDEINAVLKTRKLVLVGIPRFDVIADGTMKCQVQLQLVPNKNPQMMN
jgi:hypothetical protein